MIKAAIYRGRVRTVEDAVEFWKAGHDDAMGARDVEDIVREFLSAFQVFADWQQECWEALRAGKLKRVLEYGARLENAYSSGLHAVELVKYCIDNTQANGDALDGNLDFARAVKRFNELHAEFAAKWPFKKDQDEASIASLDRGEGIDLGGWIGELQSQDSASRP